MRRSQASLLLFSALTCTSVAHAQTAVVESLGFYKSNTITSNYPPFQDAQLVLFDEFNNGNPAVSDLRVDGTTSGYSFLNARVPPTEANGQLTIVASATTAVIAQNAPGRSFFSYGVRLNTNADDTSFIGGKLAGLGKDSTWSIGASFVPLVPAVGDSYQIRLSDFGIGPAAGDGSDVLDLLVLGRTTGSRIQLQQQNFVAGTQQVLWFEDVTIPTAATQLRLGFAHLNAGSNDINAYYSFFDGANSLGGSAVATTGAVFSDEVLTRFEMRVSTPVPEPATPFLWAGGALFVWARMARRRRRWLSLVPACFSGSRNLQHPRTLSGS